MYKMFNKAIVALLFALVSAPVFAVTITNGSTLISSDAVLMSEYQTGLAFSAGNSMEFIFDTSSNDILVSKDDTLPQGLNLGLDGFESLNFAWRLLNDNDLGGGDYFYIAPGQNNFFEADVDGSLAIYIWEGTMLRSLTGDIITKVAATPGQGQIPAPATLLLMLGGMFGLFAVSRRHK